jgi:hypothetical protein
MWGTHHLQWSGQFVSGSSSTEEPGKENFDGTNLKDLQKDRVSGEEIRRRTSKDDDRLRQNDGTRCKSDSSVKENGGYQSKNDWQ